MPTKALHTIAVVLVISLMACITACTSIPKGRLAESDYTVTDAVIYTARYDTLPGLRYRFKGFDSIRYSDYNILERKSLPICHYSHYKFKTIKKGEMHRFDRIFEIADSLHMVDRRSGVADTIYLIEIYTFDCSFPSEFVIKTKARSIYINGNIYRKFKLRDLDRFCVYLNRRYGYGCRYDYGFADVGYGLYLNSIFSFDYDRICTLVKIIIPGQYIVEAQRFIIKDRKIESYQSYSYLGSFHL